MSRMSWVRSRTRQGSWASRLRSCVGVRSWSKTTRSAWLAAATPAISSTLPAPMSVAASGRLRRCMTWATTAPPALSTSSLNSTSEASALRVVDSSAAGEAVSRSGSDGLCQSESEPEEAASAAARAPSAPGRRTAMRLEISTPTSTARSWRVRVAGTSVLSGPKPILASSLFRSSSFCLCCLRISACELLVLRGQWGWSGTRRRHSGRRWTACHWGSRTEIRRVHDASIAHNCRDRVLEDQLLLAVVFQQHGILVERSYFSSELYAADQINGDGGLVLADRVQEGVLNVLCRLVIHVPISCSLLLKVCSFDLEPVQQESLLSVESKTLIETLG